MDPRSTAATAFLVLFSGLSVTPSFAACINPPLSAEAISAFKSAEQSLITPDSDARTVEVTTRDLAGTDAGLAADLVKIAAGATPKFRTAIAAGLAQAALACGSVDEKAGLVIQEAVAGFNDGQFQASFAAVAGDLSTAATEAAAAYATASAGSVVVTNPATATNAISNPGGGGGGGAVNLLITATSPAITVSDSGKTAASEVSSTH